MNFNYPKPRNGLLNWDGYMTIRPVRNHEKEYYHKGKVCCDGKYNSKS